MYQYVYWQQFWAGRNTQRGQQIYRGILATLDRALAPVAEPR